MPNKEILKTLSDAQHIAKLLSDKKAFNIKVLDLTSHVSFTDAFIIVSGHSLTHLKSLVDYIKQECKNLGYLKLNPENTFSDSQWVLSDFGDIIIHFFIEEARQNYKLEEMWFDAPVIYVSNDDEDK